MIKLVYFSATGNTKRFVSKLNLEAHQVRDTIDDSFIILTPTYSDAFGRNAVPSKVETFLDDMEHQSRCRGVVGFGDRSFGNTFCIGAEHISRKYNVPLLHCVELSGTQTDVDKIKGIVHSWK